MSTPMPNTYTTDFLNNKNDVAIEQTNKVYNGLLPAEKKSWGEKHPFFAGLADATLGGVGGYFVSRDNPYGSPISDILAGMAVGAATGFTAKQKAKNARLEAAKKGELNKVTLYQKQLDLIAKADEAQAAYNIAQGSNEQNKNIAEQNKFLGYGDAGKVIQTAENNVSAQLNPYGMAENLNKITDIGNKEGSNFFADLHDTLNKTKTQQGNWTLSPLNNVSNIIKGGASVEQPYFQSSNVPYVDPLLKASDYNTQSDNYNKAYATAKDKGMNASKDTYILQETNRKNKATEEETKRNNKVNNSNQTKKTNAEISRIGVQNQYTYQQIDKNVNPEKYPLLKAELEKKKNSDKSELVNTIKADWADAVSDYDNGVIDLKTLNAVKAGIISQNRGKFDPAILKTEKEDALDKKLREAEAKRNKK